MATAPVRNQKDSKTLAIGVHMGNILLLIASRYPRLHDVILEVVQNALDASAKRIDVVINLQRRAVSAFDNGFGVNESEFAQALTSIGQSIKPGKTRCGKFNPLGQFGLGLIAPIGKCSTYRFISHSARPGKRTAFVEYSFDIKNLKTAKEIEGIDSWPRVDIDRDAKTWWNTYVNLKELINDDTITGIDFDDLVRDIMDRYGEAIRQGQVDLTIKFTSRDGKYQEIKIDPPEFSGEPLEEMVMEGKYCGKVSLKLYLLSQPVAKTKARLLFCVPRSDFRLPWRQISRQALKILREDDKIFEVFNSGLFEGVISIENCQVTFERDAFVACDALVDFFILLEDWAMNHGLKHVEAVSAQQRDTRFQDIGIQAVAALEKFLDLNPTAFQSSLSFLCGTISDGHTEVPGRRKAVDSKVKGTGTHQAPDGTGQAREEKPKEPRGEQEKRTHITVGGPLGSGRVAIKGQKGFTLVIEAIRNSSERYVVEENIGIIRVNSRHPDFSRCNKKQTQVFLRQYLFYIMLIVLSKYSVPEMNRAGIDIFENHLIPPITWNIVEIRSRKTAKGDPTDVD